MANRDDSAGVEVWRDIPSQPELQASSWGRIRRREFYGDMPGGGIRAYVGKPTYGVVRRAKKTATHEYMGYRYRTIGNVKVHRLVCEAFHGPCPDGMVCIHLDEDAKNNRPENLKWGTQKENLNMPAVRLRMRKSKTKIFINIDGENMSLKDASEVFGVSKDALRWRFLRKKLPEPREFQPVRQLHQDYHGGEP